MHTSDLLLEIISGWQIYVAVGFVLLVFSLLEGGFAAILSEAWPTLFVAWARNLTPRPDYQVRMKRPPC